MDKSSNNNSSKQNKKKKWIKLSLIGAALLLIPRRSSRQTSPVAHKQNADDLAKKSADNAHNTETQGD